MRDDMPKKKVNRKQKGEITKDCVSVICYKLKWEKQAQPQTQNSIQRVRSDWNTDIPLFPKPKAGKYGVVTPIHQRFTFENQSEVRLNWSKKPNNKTWGTCNAFVNCCCGALGYLHQSYGLLTRTENFSTPFSVTPQNNIQWHKTKESQRVTKITNFYPDWETSITTLF